MYISVGHLLNCGVVPQALHPCRKLPASPQRSSVVNSTPMPASPSPCWEFVWLDLVQVLSMLLPCYKFPSTALLCSENNACLALSPASGSCNLSGPSLKMLPDPVKEEVCLTLPLYGWPLCSLLLAAALPVLCLHESCHLLQKDASLKGTTSCPEYAS